MRNNNCILNLLKVIDLLQKNSSSDYAIDSSCDKPYLGPVCTPVCYNTRPISLYKKDGSLFSMNGFNVFRVEKVEDSCVTLQALTGTTSFVATGEFVTISPSCFCVIRCFPDTSITCI